MTEIQDFITRLNNSEKPDQDLFFEIATTLFPEKEHRMESLPWMHCIREFCFLQAAFRLKERLLPDWESLEWFSFNGKNSFRLGRPTKGGGIYEVGDHSSPEIALLIATLKAYEAEQK